MRRYRVVQWATGAIGRSVIRGLLLRPEFELAGVRVYDQAKVGADAGTIAGRPPVGVIATDDPEAILAMDADCVVYAPGPPGLLAAADPRPDFKMICRLLASGKNVVSMVGLIYPWAHGPELVADLETACAAGGTSVHGSGVNPGFMSDLMPVTLSSLSRQVTHVYARECSDFAGYPSWRMVHEMAGFGKTEEEYLASQRDGRAAMRILFSESLYLVAAALGVTLDSIETDLDYRLAAEEFTVAAGPIPKGAVCAARWTFNGMVEGHPFVTVEVVHKADASRTAEWGRPGYAVRVHGRPSITLTTDEDWVSNGVSAAAAHAINAIPVVCQAAPGIRTFLDLPLITGRARGH